MFGMTMRIDRVKKRGQISFCVPCVSDPFPSLSRPHNSKLYAFSLFCSVPNAYICLLKLFLFFLSIFGLNNLGRCQKRSSHPIHFGSFCQDVLQPTFEVFFKILFYFAKILSTFLRLGSSVAGHR